MTFGAKTLKKTITFAVPCYNSAEYMDNCIQCLIDLNSEDDDIEIIVVDDGSQNDNTLEKAKGWEKKYPSIVRVIHQENRGHGGAVNTGLENANGMYFKIVDSDDYLDKKGTTPIMEYLREQTRKARGGNKATDLVIGNYVYNKVSKNRRTSISYANALPQNREFTWADVKTFRLSQYLLMHALIYRTQLLRDIKFELPEHTFYVDNIVTCCPLSYVESIYYINTDMYMYYIGRPDQSVNEKEVMKNIDHLIRGIKIVIENIDIAKLRIMPRLEKYICHHLSQMMCVASVALRMINTEESKDKLKKLWEYIKNYDNRIYRKVFWYPLCSGTNIPTEAGRLFSIACYKISTLIVPYT